LKAFRFPLDQALRWRSTQFDLAKARAAAATAKLAQLRTAVEALKSELQSQRLALTRGGPGGDYVAWNSYAGAADRRLEALAGRIRAAEAEVAECMKALLEADRQMRLLSNLRGQHQARWTADFNRELEAFAAEAFLSRIQLRKSGA
jgi:capsule polysaccharide export protein KpsE/RkpR